MQVNQKMSRGATLKRLHSDEPSEDDLALSGGERQSTPVKQKGKLITHRGIAWLKSKPRLSDILDSATSFTVLHPKNPCMHEAAQHAAMGYGLWLDCGQGLNLEHVRNEPYLERQHTFVGLPPRSKVKSFPMRTP